MSLNFNNPDALAYNTTDFAATSLAGVTAATFDGGSVDTADDLILKVDTAGGNIDLATLPVSMLGASGQELLRSSTEIAVVKNSADSNLLTFLDPLTGIQLAYADRQGESMTLVFDKDNARWLFNW